MAVILLMVAVVGGTAAYFIHYLQQKRNADFFLVQAELAKQDVEKAHKEKKTEEEEKALKKQLDNLSWYLSFRPYDLKVREELGMLMANHITNQAVFNQAFGNLDMVVREDETRNDARRKLIDLMLQSGRYNDAMEHITYLLKEKKDDPELLQLMGQCEEAMGEDENAQKSYEKAIEYSPKQIDTYPRLANLLRKRLNQPKEADNYMQKLVKNNPDTAKAYTYLGSYLLGINSTEDAMKAAEKSLELSPDSSDALMLAARCSMMLDDLEKAEKYARHNMEIHKDSPLNYIVLADIIMRSKDREKALDIYDQGLKETKNAPQILWYKANLQIDLKNLDAAKETIGKLQNAAYTGPMIEYLEARIAYTQKDWGDASRRFEKVRPSLISNPNPLLLMQTDLCLGYCYGQLRNVDQQISAYQRVLAVDPFNSPARQGLTEALLNSGRVDEAVQQYSDLIRMRKIPPSGLITFASLLIRQNMQRDPTEQRWDQVEKMLDDAEKTTPDSEQIPLLRSEILHAQNRDDEAEKMLQKVHEKNPNQINIWNAMVTMAALQKKWDKAEKILADFERQIGDTVDLRLARSEYLLRRYDTKAGEYLKKLSEKIDGFSDTDRIKLWNGLLNAARRSGDTDRVKHYVGLLAQNDTNNLEIHLLRMEDAANNQDMAALEQALNDVEKVEGKGPFWLVGQTRLLILQAKDGDPRLLEKALQNMAQARELRPTWSRIPLLMGSIYDMQRKYNDAVKYYMEAINMGEHNPAAARRTVQLLFQNQRYADADKLLHQLDRLQAPFTPELTRLWVQLLIQQGEFDLAVAKARQTVSEKSNEYGEYLWLGQILAIAARQARAQNHEKDFKDLAAEAEKNLRRAVELKDDVAETWVVLVGFLSSINKTSEAEEIIDKARGKIPAEQAPRALAQCYEAVEKNDQAMEQYKLALAAKPDDSIVVCSVADFYRRIGKTVEAEALLRRIIDGKVKAEEANLLWARRQLALITAAKGGLVNMENARKLIEQNLAQGGNSPDDLRIKVTFDVTDPRRSRKDEAINTLAKMMEGQQATPEDRYNLAMLYLSTEKQLQARGSSTAKTSADDNKNSTAWVNASNILRNLISTQDANPRYLALYARALLDHGEVSGAELYANKLIKDFPNTAAAIALQAELLARRNQFEEALDLIKSFVDMKDAQPTDRSKRIQMMAQLMEQLTERLKGPDRETMAERYIRTAEMFHRQYVDEHPSQSLDLVTFFVRHDQIDDAVNILEQTWQNSDPVTIAQVSMNIIQHDKKSKELIDRVEKVLMDARVKFDNHPAVILTLGDIRVGQDRYADAENFYRDILEKNPGHAVAMNNLAVLLTLQNKKLDEALSLINKAIEITGPLASMLDTRACVYIASGNAEKAISDMEEAIADAASPVRLFHQAQALSLANQPYAASSTMQQALKAGLTKEMLQTPEIPSFDKLQKLARELGVAEGDKK